MMTIAPLGLAGALSAGPGFRTALVAALGLCLALKRVGRGVEFTIHLGRQPKTIEFGPEPIRLTGPGSVEWDIPWQHLSYVRIRLNRPHRNSAVTFLLRSGIRVGMVEVELSAYREAGERIAGFVARFAPRVHRSGPVGVFRWDTTLASEGDVDVAASGFQPMFYAGMALTGPSIGMLFTAAACAIGFDPILEPGMVAGNVGLGVTLAAFCRMTIRAVTRSDDQQAQDWRSSAYLLAAAGPVVSEAVLGILFLLQ